MQEIVHGIEYTKPTVVLLQETGIGTSEYAARTCYDSFEASENRIVQAINHNIENVKQGDLDCMNDLSHSDLLDTLAWTHFHYSILEHANLTYLIKGTSRAVLMEHSRHRIQAISVRSTRYTMSSILNAYMSFHERAFIDYILDKDMFVVKGRAAKLEAKQLFDKLALQEEILGSQAFLELAIAKSSLPLLDEKLGSSLFKSLEAGKKKRNVGDSFKWCVTDNWKVDMVVTFNLRSLKNYFQLRDSGSAFFGIQWLAEEMKKVTPKKYLDLIVK